MNHEIHEKHEKLLFKDGVYAIQGAVFGVYREMGAGFLEAVYQECLEREFRDRKIPFASQKELLLTYKWSLLEQCYMPDFICYDKIILELKAVSELGKEHKALLFNYLKACELRLGLLVNFGHYPKVQIERIIL
jgi:GxxExxY protein